jgi:hypothetical protein
MGISNPQIGKSLALADEVEIYMGTKPTFWDFFKHSDIITTRSRLCRLFAEEEMIGTLVKSVIATIRLKAAFYYQDRLRNLPAFQGGPDYRYSLSGQGVSAIFLEEEIEAKQ